MATTQNQSFVWAGLNTVEVARLQADGTLLVTENALRVILSLMTTSLDAVNAHVAAIKTAKRLVIVDTIGETP